MKEYTGVRWMKDYNKWRATISYQGVFYNCGMYTEQKDAAKARDRMIIEKNIPRKLQVLKPASKINKT